MAAVNSYISTHPEKPEGSSRDEGTNPWDNLPQQPSAHGPNGWLTRHFSMQHIQGSGGAAAGRERLISEQSLGTGTAWWAEGGFPESPEAARDVRSGWEKGQRRAAEEPTGAQYGFRGIADHGNESGGFGDHSDLSMSTGSDGEAVRLSPLAIRPVAPSNAFASPVTTGAGTAFPALPPVNTVPGLVLTGSEDLVFALDEDSGALTPPPRHREQASPKTPAHGPHQSSERLNLGPAMSSVATAGLYTRPGALARKGPLFTPLKSAKGAAYPPKVAGAPPGTSVFAGLAGPAWALFLTSLQAKIDEALADGRWRQKPTRKPTLGTSCPRW